MGAALDHAPGFVISRSRPGPGSEPLATTLLALVEAVSDASNSEQEVVATVAHMLRTGKVRLIGCFRDTPLEAFRV